MISNRHNLGKVRQGQKGVVLVVALVFLVILTLLGVSNMQVGLMEERMTSSFNDRNSLALESAEQALREAEAYLNGVAIGPFNSTKPGLHAVIPGGDVSNFWLGSTCAPTATSPSFNWSSAACSYATVATQLPHTAAPARYVIEQYADAVKSGTSVRAGQAKESTKVYRITARGVGGQASTVVILQSTFKR